jgi:hypothetical protein
LSKVSESSGIKLQEPCINVPFRIGARASGTSRSPATETDSRCVGIHFGTIKPDFVSPRWPSRRRPMAASSAVSTQEIVSLVELAQVRNLTNRAIQRHRPHQQPKQSPHSRFDAVQTGRSAIDRIGDQIQPAVGRHPTLAAWRYSSADRPKSACERRNSRARNGRTRAVSGIRATEVEKLQASPRSHGLTSAASRSRRVERRGSDSRTPEPIK